MLGDFDILARGPTLEPHGYGLFLQPALVWTHVVADALIAAAYFSIPLALVGFAGRRKRIEFNWVFWLFALFLVVAGTTHLMSIWTLWAADYGWAALVKVVAAVASVGAAIVLWPLIPKALTLPPPLELEQANAELGERVRERDEALQRLREEIVERERAEAALIQAQKMEAVGQLTGGIAHDFNNLLQAVSGSLDLIARNPADPERVRRLAERGLQAAERGTRLTGQLLAFSRVQRLDLKPVTLGPIVDELVELLARSLGPAVSIRTEIAEPATSVIADKTQLELGLMNLAINARDAMPEGGIITIASASAGPSDDYPDGAVEIKVSDTGCGMTAEVLERAFEPFFTTKGVGKGTGLGLSMVYGVARQSGGGARIESAPGQGTTVTITLRQAPVSAATEAPPALPTEQFVVGEGELILVVDDDEDVRATIRQSLETLGYRVLEAPDGLSALAVLAEAEPRLAVVDFAMPGMSGADVAREAARIRPDMKLVFASGYADSDALRRALGDGTAILRKPFQMAELARLVGEQLRAG